MAEEEAPSDAEAEAREEAGMVRVGNGRGAVGRVDPVAVAGGTRPREDPRWVSAAAGEDAGRRRRGFEGFCFCFLFFFCFFFLRRGGRGGGKFVLDSFFG